MFKNSAQISKITGALLLLFAVSILISQSLMDLFSTLLCLYLGLAWVFKKELRGFLNFRKMGFDALWVIWFVVAALGFALNRPPPPETPEGFWIARLVEYKWILILYFLVWGLHLADFKETALKWFLGASLLCAGYGLVDYFIQSSISPEYRLGGLFQFSMTYAHVYGVFFCAFFGLSLEIFPTLPRAKKIFYAVTLLVLGVSVLLTFTRGIWIAGFLAVILISFLHRIRTGIAVLVGGVVTAALLYTGVPAIKDRIDFTAKVASAKTTKESYDTERLVLWKTNWMIFKDHPWFGTGYGQNKFHLHDYYEKQGLPKDQFIGHAHNQYLHLLAGTGVLGLLCYMGVLATFAMMNLLAFLKTPKENRFLRGVALGSLAGQICFAAGSLTESNFEHSKVRFAIMLAWALALYVHQNNLRRFKTNKLSET